MAATVLGVMLLCGCQSGADIDSTDKIQTAETEAVTEAKNAEHTEAVPENNSAQTNGSMAANSAEADSTEAESADAAETGEAKAQGDYMLPTSNTEIVGWEDVKDLTQEELRIARNEIYARHGRRFKAQDLQTYFDGKSWYQGTIEPDKFSEDMLNAYEKRNIRYLKGMEPTAGLGQLSEAPSKKIIDRYGYEEGHSLLSFALKEGTAKDCGDYYQVDALYSQGIEAPGDLKYGDQVTLVFNELTGERKTLEYRQGGLYPVDEGQYASQYYYTPTEDQSPVVLYQDSEDRVDKPVYEGKLYIRKDAAREIDIENESEPVTFENLNGQNSWYNGVFFDEKGYAVRLVVYGD